jgi:hypothetical protein
VEEMLKSIQRDGFWLWEIFEGVVRDQAEHRDYTTKYTAVSFLVQRKTPVALCVAGVFML